MKVNWLQIRWSKTILSIKSNLLACNMGMCNVVVIGRMSHQESVQIFGLNSTLKFTKLTTFNKNDHFNVIYFLVYFNKDQILNSRNLSPR